jgi:hypothetical protein
MNQNVNAQALVRQIAARVKCAVCGHHFGLSDIQVLGNRDKVWAMRVNCRECRTKSLLLAVVDGKSARSVYTDLAPDEWQRFKDGPPISADDVIVMHQSIQSYDGDFSEILEDPLPNEAT